MSVLGIDVGFGFTKATDGNAFTMFKTLLGETTDVAYWSEFPDIAAPNHLHVTIDEHAYFIGDLAERQSDVRQFTLNQNRLTSGLAKIFALTAAGKFVGNDIPVSVVSGLPVNDFKQNRQRFSQNLTGYHKVTYHQPGGNAQTKKVYIRKVRMMPQPIGSVFNLMMDDNGNIIDTEFTNQKIGVVDIGFRTTDFIILDRMQFVERGSITTDDGIAKSFSIIAKRLREKSGVNIELYRLFNAVEKETITVKGTPYDISRMKKEVFAHAAETIAGSMDGVWAEDWDIERIILTGGGGMALSKYLLPLVPGNVVPPDENTDARLNNVRGYLKYAKFVWGRSGLCDLPLRP